MTDQPTGRALVEAAARAMGWHQDEYFGTWIDTSGEIQGTTEYAVDWTEQMLAWLHERGWIDIESRSEVTHCEHWTEGMDRVRTVVEGHTLRDALMRLVVAVAEREATNG